MHYRHSSVAYYGFINALYHHSLYPLVSCSGLCSGLPAVPRIIRLNVVIIVWNEKRSPATQVTTWRSYSRIKVDKRTRTMAQWHGIVSTWKGKKGKRQQQQHNTLYCNPPFPFLCFLILRTCSNNNTILIFLFSSSYGRLDVNGANHLGSSFLVIWTPKVVLAATNDQLRSARVPTLNSSPRSRPDAKPYERTRPTGYHSPSQLKKNAANAMHVAIKAIRIVGHSVGSSGERTWLFRRFFRHQFRISLCDSGDYF